MNKEKIQKELNSALGKKELQNLIEIKRISDETKDVLEQAQDNETLAQISNKLDELKSVMEEVKDKDFPEFPKIPEPPKEVKVSNQPEIKTQKVEFPENLKKLRNTDLSPVVKAITQTSKISTDAIIKQLSTIIVGNKSPDDAVPVRIVVSREGSKQFLNEFGGSGGSREAGPQVFHTGYKDSDGNETYVQLDASGNLPVSASLTVDTLEGIGIYDNFEQETLSATDASSSQAFSQQVETADITNIGTNEVFINFDAAATTSHFRLQPGDSYTAPLKHTAIHAICSSGETTTLRIIGYY